MNKECLSQLAIIKAISTTYLLFQDRKDFTGGWGKPFTLLADPYTYDSDYASLADAEEWLQQRAAETGTSQEGVVFPATLSGTEIIAVGHGFEVSGEYLHSGKIINDYERGEVYHV